MVAPLVIAGVRVAAGGAAKSAATGARTVSRRSANSNSPIRNVKKLKATDTVSDAFLKRQQYKSTYSNEVSDKKNDPRYQTTSDRYMNEQQTGTNSYRGIKNQKKVANENNPPSSAKNINAVPAAIGPKMTPRMQSSRKEKLAKKLVVAAKVAMKMGRLVSIITPVLFAIWIFVQLPFLGLGMAGIGMEIIAEETFNWIPIIGDSLGRAASWLIPGYSLFGISWMMNAAIGILTMVVCMAVLTAFKIPWYKGKWAEVGTVGTVILYFIPVLQMFPWVYLFLFMVWISRVSDA